jgi:uncharacterized protein YndB with AHSA1/START domain
MIDVSASVVITRPIEEVFAFVADQTNAPRWQDGLVEVRRVTDGPIGVGTRHTAVRAFIGRRLELTNEYVRFVPNQEVAFAGASGPLVFEASYTTEATPEGTQLTSTIRMRPGGLFRIAEPLIAADLRRDVRANLAALKALLEQVDRVDLPTASSGAARGHG